MLTIMIFVVMMLTGLAAVLGSRTGSRNDHQHDSATTVIRTSAVCEHVWH